jgi:phosphate-selective porin OprO/OprP
LAEYIESRQRLERGPDAALLSLRAWQVAGYFVLGGKPGYEGPTIEAPLDRNQRTLGALELAVRYNELSIDGAAFPVYADPNKVARRASAVGLVANWHWNRIIRLSLMFERTWFKGGAPQGNRPPENVLLQMIQAAF